MNNTTSKHRTTNRTLMAASLLLALTPLVQAGQITWGLQDVTIGQWNGSSLPDSTVTGSFVWDTSLNGGAGGVASAHIAVYYLGHTLDVNTADGATVSYFGYLTTTGVTNGFQLTATAAEYAALGVFNGYYNIGFGDYNLPLGFSDANTAQISVGDQLGFSGNGCCETATAGYFVNQDLASAPEPASIALAGPVLGLWLLLRRRRTV